MRTRPRCIGLWLSDDERDHLLEQCAVTGLNANAYIRKLIMGESLRPRPPDGYAALLRELSALGSNVTSWPAGRIPGVRRPRRRFPRRRSWSGRCVGW